MKTGAWLRGGRGKIAGMVAQKSSDGKGTVLRELVTPSNPQTVDQMATRLAFGTVTQAAALMLPIIGQTFKGQGDENMNRRRFVSLNVPQLKAEALSQDSGNTSRGAFRGKNSTALIPNPYIISEGTLNLPETMITSEDDGELVSPTLNANPITLTVGEYYSPATILAALFGIDETQQITLVGVFTEMSENVDYDAVANNDFVRNSVMRAWRGNLNPNAASFVYSNGMTQEQLATALIAGFDSAKTSSDFISAIQSHIVLSEGKVSIGWSFAELLTEGVEGYRLQAAGFILSELRNNVWDYSRTVMTCVAPSGQMVKTNNLYFGLTFGDALIDYIGEQAASKLFTRKGGTINTI